MNSDDYNTLAELLKKRSGLALSDDKSYLLESRLMPIVRRRRLAGLEELAAEVRAGKDESLLVEVTEVMTTNESFFFRDTRPFDQFKEVVLPYLKKERSGKKQIKIWSAACSSGQEPYSLAMLLKENAHEFAGWKVEIIATDISDEILSKAKAGIYSQFEVQRGLPIQLLMKYFEQIDTGWEINSEVRSMVQFKNFNLLDSMGGLGVFDVVFCRNVLIYFDQETKSNVLGRIAKQMNPDGFLYLGGAETVLGICDSFKSVPGQRGLYSFAENLDQCIAG